MPLAAFVYALPFWGMFPSLNLKQQCCQCQKHGPAQTWSRKADPWRTAALSNSTSWSVNTAAGTHLSHRMTSAAPAFNRPPGYLYYIKIFLANDNTRRGNKPTSFLSRCLASLFTFQPCTPGPAPEGALGAGAEGLVFEEWCAGCTRQPFVYVFSVFLFYVYFPRWSLPFCPFFFCSQRLAGFNGRKYSYLTLT